ncbi:MAG: hypothetical protein Q4C95_11415 [Planctomycetia bacterium]|nr:hypothetical protein [Planctomycetia bacterium]
MLEIDQAFITNYFANRLYSDIWNNTSASDQTKAIDWAKTIIEGAFDFNDTACKIDNNGGIIWNNRVLAAICEEAVWLLRQDPTEYPELLTLGLSEADAGASIKTDKTMIIPLVCNAAIRIIGNMATIVDPEAGGGTICSTMLS